MSSSSFDPVDCPDGAGAGESASWELSKENIQPLRGGRKATAVLLSMQGGSHTGHGGLSLGPTVEQQKVIKDAKSAFEAELRIASTLPDPLDPWHRYIAWVEQTFPKGGKEGRLHVLLEKCIKEFKDDGRFNQDQRYLDVWIKYANTSQTPLDIYSFMYAQNLCTKLPDLYVNWAWELEQVGNFKKAEQVFIAALEKLEGAEEKDFVGRKRELFQARVIKKIMEEKNEEATPIAEEEERAVLASLKGHGKKKQVVGSVRIGEAKKADGPGVLPSVFAAKPNSSQPVFGIYQDENRGTHSDPCLPTMKDEFGSSKENLPFRQQTNRENEQIAGKWSQARVGKKSHAIPLDQIKARPSFEIHQDEGSKQQSLITPRQDEFATSNVLSAKKVEKEVPLAVFEPPDPTQRPMYCKHLVYQGTTEFSFEELRAIKVRRRLEEKALEEKMSEMKRMALEVEERQEMMKREQENLAKQQEQFRIMQQREQENLAKQQEQFRIMQENMLQEQQKQLALMQKQALLKQEEEFKRMQEEFLKKANPPREVFKEPEVISAPKLTFTVHNDESEKSLQTSSADVSDRKASLLEDTAAFLHVNGKEAPGNWHKSPVRVDNNVSIRGMAISSPTVNTREANALVQKMWRESEEAEDKQQRLAPPKEVSQFQIFCDDAAPKKPQPFRQPFAVFTDENAMPKKSTVVKPTTVRAPFAIFQDNNSKENISSSRPRLSSSDQEKDCEVKDKKENVPPSDYQQVCLDPARKSHGVLQPSCTVPFVPLDIQEAILDEDEQNNQEKEMSSFEKMPPPSGLPIPLEQQQKQPSRNPNMTIALPSMEAFEEMAERMSTPFHGRRYCPKEDEVDENTCAVEIFTKKQQPIVETREECGIVGMEQNNDDPPLPPNLSPIMETSREHNYRSSSSSGHSICHQLMKSHWGNTGQSTNLGHSAVDTKTPGSMLGAKAMMIRPSEITCSSGYMGDDNSSAARTPGMFLLSSKKATAEENDDVRVKSPIVPPNLEKRQKMSESFVDDDEEEEDEMTGCFRDMMSKFQKDCSKAKAQLPSVKLSLLSTTGERSFAGGRNSFLGTATAANAEKSNLDIKSSFLQESLKETYSFLEKSDMASKSLAKSFQRMAPDCPSPYLAKLSESPEIDVTAPSFARSLERSPALDFSERIDNAETSPRQGDERPPLDETATAQSDLVEGVSQLNIQSTAAILAEVDDPFDESVQVMLLGQLEMPVSRRRGYFRIPADLPQVRSNREVRIGHNTFLIGQCKGEGAYGKVFKAMKKDDANLNETIADMDVVLKIQKPACEWEFYICTEIHSRLQESGSASKYREWFMSIPRCFTYDDGSIFVSEHHQGTLLDVVNNVLAIIPKSQHEAVAMYFVIEMLIIAERLREVEIVHGDIKPDNFLIQSMPRLNFRSENPFANFSPSLQLIDFGRSIDLKLFPKGKSFTHCFTKEDMRSPEMLQGKPWTYQLDYFGIASTAYVLLSGTYMVISKNQEGNFFPKGNFKRWWNQELWTDFFTEFLNIPSCEKLPNLGEWRQRFEIIFCRDKHNTFSDIVNAMFAGR